MKDLCQIEDGVDNATLSAQRATHRTFSLGNACHIVYVFPYHMHFTYKCAA